MPTNGDIFGKAKLAFSNTLSKSGFKEKLSYTSTQNDINIIKKSYYTPHSANIKTNIYW